MAMTISGTSGVTFPDSTSMSTGQQACKAWVKFTGTSGAVGASYNVSSVSRTGTGNYTINFTSALADAQYAVSGIVYDTTATGAACVASTYGTISTTSFQLRTNANNAGSYDFPYAYAMCFR